MSSNAKAESTPKRDFWSAGWFVVGPAAGAFAGAVGAAITVLVVAIVAGELNEFLPVVLVALVLGALIGAILGLPIGGVLALIDRRGVPDRFRVVGGAFVTALLAFTLPLLVSLLRRGWRIGEVGDTLGYWALVATGPAIVGGLTVAWLIRRDLRSESASVEG